MNPQNRLAKQEFGLLLSVVGSLFNLRLVCRPDLEAEEGSDECAEYAREQVARVASARPRRRFE